jgi:predicted phage tail protein
MNDGNSQALSEEQVRQAASETLREGTDIRARVHDITLLALRNHRFDRHGIREVVRAVTEGIALGAGEGRGDMRRALSEALKGLDQALVKSAEAGSRAIEQLASTSRDFSDSELKQALATLRKLEDDFLATAGQVAEAANARVRPELRHTLSVVRQSGTETGKLVASLMADLAQRFSAASLDAAIAGIEAAGAVGSRFALLASGILSGLADALQPPPKESTPQQKPEQKDA